MKKKLLLILIIIFTFIFVFIYNNSKLNLEPSNRLNGSVRIFEQRENLFFEYEIFRYDSKINITKSVSNQTKDLGMNVDLTNLYLGQIPRGSASQKTLNLTNNLKESYKMEFFVFGNISKLIKLQKNFIIKPGQNVEYPISAETNMETPVGMYYGEIDVVTVISKNKLAKILQEVI